MTKFGNISQSPPSAPLPTRKGWLEEQFKSDKEIKPHGAVCGLYGGLGKLLACGEAFPFSAGFIHGEY